MKPIKIILAIAFSLGFSAIKAGLEPILSGKRQGTLIGVDSVITVTDDKFSCISSGTCSPKFKTPVLKNAVVLGVDHDNKNCYQSYSFTVTLELTKTPLSNPGVTQKDTIILTLSWDAVAGVTAQDKSVFYTDGYIKIESKVLSYTSSLAANAVPANLYIENILKKERYYGLNYTGTSIYVNAVSPNQNDELTVNWTAVTGAEEYDLEYMYIDDFGDWDGTSVSYKSASSIPVDFRNNATRVTVKGTSHTLKNLYQHGYLLFRVRFVGVDTVSYTQRLESKWSSHSFGTTVSGFGTGGADRYAITTNHEDTLNWQWTSSFAEEGKSKTVISYFDGSLRSRQMVTYTNTDQLTIVAESFYDHVGRKTVDALPVPSGDSIIKFYRNFNLSAYTHKTYSWRDFDTTATGDTCNNHLTGMDTASGASRYYSHNNPDKNLYQTYVPDAKQYPFVQVEFMPDNTGRVRKQSGVGYDHRMGSGHETQYFYGKPTQQELDMLFGVEVGDFNRYKKNMVVDPNGSISVSYLSPAGKVIATALAGENPSNLSVLPADTARKRIIESLHKSLPVVDSLEMSISMTHDLTLSTNSQIDFDYKILKNQLQLGCTGATICYDCIYDLTFSVTDMCGKLLHDTTFIGIKPFDTLCNNDSFMHSFSLALDKGSYRVNKQLSVNKESFDYYQEVYLRNNTCARTVEELYDSLENEIDYTECVNSCDACLNKLGTLANYKTSRFTDLDTNGMDIDSLVAQFEEEYAYYEADCKKLCDTLSQCEIDYYRILQDVVPGGQYALYTLGTGDEFTVTDVLSFLDSTANNKQPNYMGLQRDWRNDNLVYFNSNGDTAYVWHDSAWVKPNDLPDSVFVQKWDPAWANTLIKMHPEYCYYQWCILNEASNKFDNRLLFANSYAAALTDSLLDPVDTLNTVYPTAINDPFFKTGGLGNSWKAAVQNAVRHYFTDSSTDYTMWQAAAIIASCKEETTVAGTAACLAANPFGSGSTDTKNAQWEVFRSLYLSVKQKYKDTVRSSYAYTNSCANCRIGHNNQPLYSKSCNSIFTDDSFKIKQKQYPSYTEVLTVPLDSGSKWEIIQKNRNRSQSGIKSECQSQCESYANNWMIALKNCGGFSSDSAALRDSLINICKLGCDQFNPLGARSVSPENEHLVTRKNFKEILDYFFTTNKLCNQDLIPFPYEYNHNYTGDNLVPYDDCFDALLDEALSSTCILSGEGQALMDLFSDLANGSKFKSPTAINIQANVNSTTWTAFTANLMSYNSGHADSLNQYYTYTSGNNLKAVIRSRYNGVWDSCIITLNAPVGHASSFWDSIASVIVLQNDPCGSQTGLSFTLNIFLNDLASTEYLLEGYSACYPVCGDTGTVVSRVKTYFEDTYCKTFSNAEINSFINVNCGDSLAVAYIPRDLSCRPSCITCDKFYPANTTFWNEYSSIYTNSDTVYKDTNFIAIYTNYLNNYLGLNHSYFEYEDFKKYCDSFYRDTVPNYYNYARYYSVINGCDSIPTGKLDTLMNKLSLCDNPLAWTADTISCDSALRQAAYEQALDLYEAQQDTLKGIFRRQYFRKCMNVAGLENFTMAYDIKQYHYTLYYYDQADNLIKTVPPAGVRLITHADTLALVASNRDNKVAANYYNTPHHNLVTNYKYNTLNAVTDQTTPDGGITTFFYDRLGRIAVSQNAKQAGAASQYYSYTKYDALGRITEVGENKHTTNMTDATCRNPALLEAWLASAALYRQVTRTYYDNKAGGSPDAQFTAGQENLRNRVAYVTYDEDATGTYDYATYYTYDIHGNVKQLVHDYTELQAMAYGYFKLKYEYDLISGNVNKVSYQEGKQDQFFHEYVYDADNRIRQVFTSRDNILKDNDAKYYYYQHGPLARTEIGELKVQGMDYAYTIHGWLKGVNSGTLDSSRDIGKDGWWNADNNRRYIPKDEYGFTLGYYAGDYYDIGQKTTAQHFEINVSGGFNTASPSLYNGNIRHMVTAIGKFMDPSTGSGGSSAGLGGVMGYAYKYDHLNRISRMDAYDSINMVTNSWNTGATAMSQYHNRFTYDANGNILTQVRRGAESSNLALDSLVYKYYPNTNRLSHVDDVVDTANYDDDIDDQDSLNYKYDAIGNLIYDKAEQIDSIQWNVYGKISRIVRATTSTKAGLQFTYGPDGTRFSKKVIYPNDTSNRSYIEYYVRDASGNIMATYMASNPYFEPIDTSYDKIIGKLIDTMGLASFSQFIQTRFAHNDSFYTKLGRYIPDSTFLDSFTTGEILNCVGDQMYHQLFSCCNGCNNNLEDAIITMLDIANAEQNSLVPYIMDCKPEVLLEVILRLHGTALLDNIGNDARILLYGYFRTTAGYLHVNSAVGDTTDFLLSDVPRSELIRFMTHELHTGLYMGYDDYMDALTDVIHTYVYDPNSEGMAYLWDDLTASSTLATRCKIIECLGNCPGAGSESTCSNWGVGYLEDTYGSYYCSGAPRPALRNYIKNTPELLAFVHSRLQLCYGDRYEKMLVKTLSDQIPYATFKNCGTRITEFGYEKYITDSLISKLVTDNPPQLISVLNQCDSVKLLKAVGTYNIKALVNKINARVPQGSTYITNTCAYFQLTIPRPVGMACDDYLAQVVPMDSLLRHIRLNYWYYVDDIGAMPVADLTEVFSRYYSECDFKDCTWPKYANGTLDFDSTHLISYTRDRYWPYLTKELYDCNNDTFTRAAAYTRPYVISELFERWHYPLDSFMTHVQAYWNSTVRNRIDVDTMKRVQFLTVNEWHLYGSARLGVLQSNSDTVRGVVRTYKHRVSNDTLAQNYFDIDTLKYYKFGVDSIYKLHKGLRKYEGTNHLGNVLVVFTDKRIPVCTNDTISYYRADVTNAYDYYPFGAPLRRWGLPKYAVTCDSVFVITFTPDITTPIFEPTISSNAGSFTHSICITGQGYSCEAEVPTLAQGMDSLVKWFNAVNGLRVRREGYTLIIEATRCVHDTLIFNAFTEGDQIITRNWRVTPTGPDNYRFGFNEQEKDNEVSGEGNSMTAEYWQYDSRLGRRWNRDPVVKHHESPYACFANNPMAIIDPDGRDSILVNDDGTIKSVFEKAGDHRVFNSKGEEFKFNDFNLDKQQLEDMLPSKKGGAVINAGTGERSKSRYEWDYENEPIKLFYYISSQKALGFIIDAGANELRMKNEMNPLGRYTRAIQYGHSNFDFVIPLQQNYSGQTAEENGVVRTNFADGTGGFFVFGAAKAIYNLHDAGNFLTGGAFYVAGYAWWELSWGSNVNEWLSLRPGDSDADQKALKEGFDFYFWQK